jgi:hypothetical protein
MADLTWPQQQCKALGLPFEGAQSPALLISLHDAANTDLGLERYSLFAPVIDGANRHPEELANTYIERIVGIIRKTNLFKGLERPILSMKCVPALDADGNFPAGQRITERELDWQVEEQNYVKSVAAANDLLAGLTLPNQ